MKRYIASDFHNGNDVSDYDRVMSFLELVDDDADEFLVIGDWEELLFSNMNILTTVAPYKYVTQKVRDIATRKPTFSIVGNHNWNLGLFASLIEPVKLIPPFAENGVYFCHGHEFDWLSVIVGTPVDPIYFKNAFPFLFPHGVAIWIINKWLGKEEDVYYWQRAVIHERVAAFGREKRYHSVIFGHTHYPTEELRGGIRLYNTGDMIDSYSYLIQTDGIIELQRFI